jgi:hypothetical protein
MEETLLDQDRSFFETDPAIDLIRTSIPEGKPDWTENIAWTMHDPKCNVSIFGHLGRLQPDRRIWEGFSLLYLPDGSAYANRSLGVSLSEARNGHYHYQPLIPGKLWRYAFNGVAQRVKPEALHRRAVADEAFEETGYDLLFEAIEPVFNMHKSDLASERMHLEHAGRIRGVVKAGGRAFEIDCTAYRDHSMSQRTFTTLDTETWAHAAFPSGRIFSLLEVMRGDRRILEGHIREDGTMHLAHPLAIPTLADLAGNPDSGVIRLESGGGRVEIRWELVKAPYVPFQLLRPVGMRAGIDPADETSCVVLECPAKFIWDDEIAYGWLERTRPLSALRA